MLGFRLILILFVTMLYGSGIAHAVRLEIDEAAPLWMHLGAAILLYAHISGGAIGLISGVAAIGSRKGQPIHRAAGKIFFLSMFITYAIGAGVAPFLTEGQRPNFVGGLFALYLLISGVWTARQRGSLRSGANTYLGMAAAFSIMASGLVFMWMGANSPTGTIDGSPPHAFFLFAIGGAFALAGEVHVLARGALFGASKLARHLWRMCFSMFIASASLFLGQPQVFAESFNASFWPYLLAFAPLIAMAVWLVLVRIPKR